MEIKAEELISLEAKRLADKYDKDYLDCEDLMKITGLGKGNVRALMNRFDFPRYNNRKTKSYKCFIFCKMGLFSR